MKELIIAIILFIVGLILLIKGGDWFVDGSSDLAEIFKIPEILIGATIVSIGTTLPEVMVSATSALSGHAEISYGNAIGSVICNTALIASLTIAIRPTGTDKKSLMLPTVFFFASATLYAVVAYFFGTFYKVIGIVFLLAFCVYLFVSAKNAKNSPKTDTNEQTEELSDKERKKKIIKDVIFLVLGATLITFGANLLVDNGTIIAKSLGIPESVIALTFIALGTSLPELITAITALIKGHSALSLGNLIGANLFNIVFVAGTAITLSPTAFSIPTEEFFSFNRSLIIDIPVMFASMLILTLPPLIKGKLYRWQGIVLLCIYSAFCALQFAL